MSTCDEKSTAGTTLLAPDTILQSRYRVTGHLGKGGMGAVYEAIDLRLGHTVALKQTLTNDEGQTTFRRLLAEADVVVENLPARVQRAWRVTWPDLQPLNRGLVLVSVSCYGQDGPYADRPGAGTLAEAFAGLTHLTGDPDGPPMLPSVPLGDLLTGAVGTIGALVALQHRNRTGEGQHVDVSMYEPVLQLLGVTVASWDEDGPPPMRHGSRVPGGVPDAGCCGAIAPGTRHLARHLAPNTN